MHESTATLSGHELKRKSARGGVHTWAAQVGIYGLQVIGTVVLARLVSPADFGLVAMVTAITGLVSYMGVDLGLTSAVVQRKDLSVAQSNGLFWINLGAGAGFTLLFFLAGPLLALFYGKAQLTLITIFLAPIFLLTGMGVQHYALLSRQMRFGTVAAIQFLSTLLGVVAAIIAALAGAGYWALVIQQVAAAVASVALLWWLNPWRPGLPQRGVGLGSFVRFGGNVTVFNLLGQLARSFDRIVIGRFCGAADLGLYTRGASLLLLPLGQLLIPFGQVMTPVLCRLQDDRERFRHYFSKALNALAFGIFIPVAMLVALADDVIVLLLGPAWKESALLFKLLALSALTQPLYGASTWVATAQGKSRQMRQWSMVSAPLICVAFLVGVKWGVVGVAISYTVASYTVQTFGLSFLLRGTPVTFKTIVASIWRPACLGALAFLGTSLCCHWTAALAPLLRTIVASSFGFVVLLGTIASWPSARKDVMGLWETSKLLRKPAPAPVNS